jgi:hypothetical protein
MTAIEMNFSEEQPGTPFFFYHKRNEEILGELEVELADDKLIRHKSNWLRHVTRINNRMPKKLMLNG